MFRSLQAHLELSGEDLGRKIVHSRPFPSNFKGISMFRSLQAHLELSGEDLGCKIVRSLQISIEF